MMPEYQQTYRMHEPKDKRMWGYEVKSKHTPTWAYEDVRMQGYKQASTQEHKDIKMRGCEDINKSIISNKYVTSRLHVDYYNFLHTGQYTLYA